MTNGLYLSLDERRDSGHCVSLGVSLWTKRLYVTRCHIPVNFEICGLLHLPQ
jgi:hypothetical protein